MRKPLTIIIALASIGAMCQTISPTRQIHLEDGYCGRDGTKYLRTDWVDESGEIHSAYLECNGVGDIQCGEGT